VSQKILVVAPYTFLPYRSGGQKFIAQFLEALGQQASVTVLSTAQDPDYSPSKHYRLIPALAYSFFRYFDFTLKATIIDLIERNRYDWIVWEHPYYGWLANIIKKKTGIKTFLHTHNIEYQRFRSLGKLWWPLLRRYEKEAFATADKIGFITKEDKRFAIEQWQTDPQHCIDIPYGVTIDAFPTDRAECRKDIFDKHSITNDNTILLFNGSLDYKPNYKALQGILKELLPRLQNNPEQKFTLLICGKGLPKRDKELAAYRDAGVIYTGFVDNIDPYIKAADIFLNPVVEGGGIKTKMIEAIALGTPVIAMETAAIGIAPTLCQEMLVTTPDGNWDQFAKEIIVLRARLALESFETPPAFYSYFNWKSITERLLGSLADQFSAAKEY
jgi:glycosyltransferase involved in cell wall biosynthesis